MRAHFFGNRFNGIRSESGAWWRKVYGAIKWRIQWHTRLLTAQVDMAKDGFSAILPGKNICRWPGPPTSQHDDGPGIDDSCAFIRELAPGAQGEEDALLAHQVNRAVTFIAENALPIPSAPSGARA